MLQRRQPRRHLGPAPHGLPNGGGKRLRDLRRAPNVEEPRRLVRPIEHGTGERSTDAEMDVAVASQRPRDLLNPLLKRPAHIQAVLRLKAGHLQHGTRAGEAAGHQRVVRENEDPNSIAVMPPDLRDRRNPWLHLRSEELNDLLAGPFVRNHTNAEGGKETRNLNGLIACDECMRDCKSFDAAIPICEGDIASQFSARASRVSASMINSCRTDDLPIGTTMGIESPRRDAAVDTLKSLP